MNRAIHHTLTLTLTLTLTPTLTLTLTLTVTDKTYAFLKGEGTQIMYISYIRKTPPAK